MPATLDPRTMLKPPSAAGRSAAPGIGASVPHGPAIGAVGSTLGSANRAFSGVSNNIFMLGIASTVLKGMGGLLPKWLGGGVFMSLGNAASAPGEILKENNIGDTVHAVSASFTKASSVLDKVLGTGKSAELAAKARGHEERVGEVIFKNANTLSTTVGNALQRGIDGFAPVAKFFNNRAAKLSGKADGMHSALREESGKILEALAAGGFSEAHSALSEARNQMGANAAGMNTSDMQAALTKATEALKTAAENKDLRKAAGKAQNSIGEFARKMASTEDKFNASQRWGDVKGFVSGIPGQLKEANLSDVVYKGMNYTRQAMNVYGNLSQTGSGIDTLKEMYAAVNGGRAKNISTFKILFSSKVPECVKDARGQYWKAFFGRTLSNIVDIGVGQKFMSRVGGMKGMALSLGTSFGVEAVVGHLTSANRAVDCYAQMMHFEQAGKQIPPELYAEFIGNASKHARGASNKAVQVLAQQYAEEGAYAKNVLIEIENGEFDQRRAKLHSLKVDAQREQAPAQTHQQGRPAIGQFTSMLQGQGAPALGKA